jgi:glycine cleavage system transcriptional repressor
MIPDVSLALAVMGQDRPGIVADVTACLLTLGANLEDVATSILGGHFAMMLVVSVPQSQVQVLRGALRLVEVNGNLSIDVWDVEGSTESTPATHVLSVYGPDRKGIVHAVAEALASFEVNICDMSCRLHPAVMPVYVLTVEVAIPRNVEAVDVGAAVGVAAATLGFTSSVRSLEQADL